MEVGVRKWIAMRRVGMERRRVASRAAVRRLDVSAMQSNLQSRELNSRDGAGIPRFKSADCKYRSYDGKGLG